MMAALLTCRIRAELDIIGRNAAVNEHDRIKE
jgi:hypothetical protein